MWIDLRMMRKVQKKKKPKWSAKYDSLCVSTINAMSRVLSCSHSPSPSLPLSLLLSHYIFSFVFIALEYFCASGVIIVATPMYRNNNLMFSRELLVMHDDKNLSRLIYAIALWPEMKYTNRLPALFILHSSQSHSLHRNPLVTEQSHALMYYIASELPLESDQKKNMANSNNSGTSNSQVIW